MSFQEPAEQTDGSTPGQSQEVPLSITQLNWVVKNLVETLPRVWVEGEVSGLSRPSSGHLYFTLKDGNSQIRTVIWRSTAERMRFQLKDGMSVVCSGIVEVYAPRGSYQLIVERLEPKGEGPLQVAFRQLHQKLQSEGLFDDERKKTLPRFPRRIGFVTSPSGAAIHDFLEASRSQWTDYSLLLIPARVQGEHAASEIARGIRLAHQIKPELDLIIVGRGGGSMEDLWCFNEEKVVRTISKSRIPIISAVGHEIDVTLSDLVADSRALTPTHAAALALPNRQDLQTKLEQLEKRVRHIVGARIKHMREQLNGWTQRGILARPHEIHKARSQKVDELENACHNAIWRLIESKKETMSAKARAVEALSPLNVLGRGYSLTQQPGSHRPISDAKELQPGQQVKTTLDSGTFLSTVGEIELSNTKDS